MTGVVLKHTNRYQINMRLDKLNWFSEPGYEDLFSKRDVVFAPVLWFEEAYELESEFSSKIFSLTYTILYIGSIMTIVFAILGAVLCIISCIILHTARWSSSASAHAVRSGLRGEISIKQDLREFYSFYLKYLLSRTSFPSTFSASRSSANLCFPLSEEVSI
jgi:hypothetical protein